MTERDSQAVLTGLCKPGSCRMALLLILSICIWSVKTLKSCTVLADIQWTLDSGGIGRRLDVRINPIRFQGHGVMGSSTLIRSRAEVQFDRTPGDRNFIHIACKSQSIHCVELNPYPLRRNDRDRRCRSEARRTEHSLVCERSVVRILPLR